MSLEVKKINDFSLINRMANNEGYLYVINNTDAIPNNGGIRGVFHMVIKDSNGEEISINIPNTWVPVDLAQFCDPSIIANSHLFRSNVNSGYLVVIAKDQATQILNTEAAKSEINRYKKEQQERNATRSLSTSDRATINTNNTTPVMNNTPDLSGNPAETAASSQNGNNQPLSNFDREFMNILQRYNAGKATEKQTIIDISSINGMPSDDVVTSGSNQISASSSNIRKYLSMVIGANEMPSIEEVFGSADVLSDVSFQD
jgi:hypothetical protein